MCPAGPTITVPAGSFGILLPQATLCSARWKISQCHRTRLAKDCFLLWSYLKVATRMVKSNAIPLFLFLFFSLNYQLSLDHSRSSASISLGLYFAFSPCQKVLHVFSSQAPFRDGLSADLFFMYLQFPGDMPDPPVLSSCVRGPPSKGSPRSPSQLPAVTVTC